jgi:predicted CXXCH cytochrome family protein
MADYFDQSGHGEYFQQADLPGCALCHDHHAIQAVEDADLHARAQDVCLTCHEPPDTLGLEFDRIAAVLDSLNEAVEQSRAVLEEAENVGMEVSQALFELDDVRNVVTRAHSAIHTFQVVPVREEVQTGLQITQAAEARGYEALDEHRFRRVGLGASVTIIILLIVGLLMKIRELERAEET